MKMQIQTLTAVCFLIAMIFVGQYWAHTALDLLVHVGLVLIIEIAVHVLLEVLSRDPKDK